MTVLRQGAVEACERSYGGFRPITSTFIFSTGGDLFLQSWRATLIPVLAVPISLIGTFAGMSALRFSINTLTLFGLVLAIGIVVDDAIVVVENVEQPARGAP